MSIDINIRVTDDRKKTILTFKPGQEGEGAVELNQAELEDLIRVLGTLRWAMADGQEIPEISGARLKPAYQTKWAIQREEGETGTLLAFQHPGYGAIGFVLSEEQIKTYSNALQKSIQIANKAAQEDAPKSKTRKTVSRKK